MRHLTIALTALATLTSLSACDPEVEETPPKRPLPNPSDMTAEMTPEDMTPDVPTVCVPTTCEALGENTCGPQPDGCDGMLECGPCGCDPADVEGTCASQPCQVAVKCGDAGACVYAAKTCSGLLCVCPPGQDCENEPVRCTDACPALACDASPMMVEGQTVYQNLCVDVEPATCRPENVCSGGGTCDDSDVCQAETCGVCGLGQWQCSPGVEAVCDPLELGTLEEVRVNCEDDSLTSTFVFVDSTYEPMNSTGSRMRPFSTLEQAFDAATTRDVKAIVIAGSPVLPTLVVWDKPLSLYGGYTNVAGIWTRDVTQRPVVSGSLLEPNGSSVGLRVMGDASGIVLSGLRIEAPRPQDMTGASSIALALKDVTDVTLHDLELVAAAPRPGSPGSPGAPGETGGAGKMSANLPGGVAGTNSSCAAANGGTGGNGGFGGNASTSGVMSAAGIAGGPRGGQRSNGQPGGAGTMPGPQPPGAPGVFGGMIQGYTWVPTGLGSAGARGEHGPGGGGGGGGGIGNSSFLFGGGGGGGGAGGCGGHPGVPGRPGGATIAVLLTGTQGVVVVGGAWTTAAGGRGGDGGLGGDGGPGRTGGNGRVGNGGGRGGDGGDGVQGGKGSDGGSGAGGPAYGILCDEGVSVEVRQMPTLTLGVAGPSGEQSGVPAEPGESVEMKGCL